MLGLSTTSAFRFATQHSSVPAACVAALACLALAPGCDKPAPPAAEQPVPRVTVADVVEREVTDSDDFTGKTEASAIVEVRARVYGYLRSTEFKDGDYVKEGQTLFTIEPDEYQAIHEQSLSRIALTTANYDLAKSKLARDEKLVPTNAISQEEYEESVAAMKSAEATVVAAKADANRTALDLKYTVIKAPMSGRIDRALVSDGNLLTGGLTNGTLLTKIVAEQPMYVYFDVDERSLLGYMRQRDRSNVDKSPGSLREQEVPCYVQLADEKDFPHVGKIDFASAEVSAGTGTARLRGVFENKDRSLVSGLFVRIRVPVSKPYRAVLIPERALATDQNIRFVYVVGQDGKAERRNVELGGQRGDLRIVKSGLAAGDRVIVKGLQRVRPGQKVEAENEAATPTPPRS
ncbi:Efflux pump periplasmic linker BepF [Pirellulimonas nuda]|uniref:Efflux pump periplasmic linker BepF n=1 Tax=Pirellulimonas nuda TaxID=2528009 RepID=A0A518DC17_9BACT|nr:efflux RND transporter periplasmic adaptor subunit [Pirellulimonas nuda]QDU89021.1 Efflux pump periplasmic linker BepF [Pirellulimonas nuda]